jgi:hypothetical protein
MHDGGWEGGGRNRRGRIRRAARFSTKSIIRCVTRHRVPSRRVSSRRIASLEPPFPFRDRPNPPGGVAAVQRRFNVANSLSPRIKASGRNRYHVRRSACQPERDKTSPIDAAARLPIATSSPSSTSSDRPLRARACTFVHAASKAEVNISRGGEETETLRGHSLLAQP